MMSICRRLFLKWLQGKGKGEEKDVQKVFWALIGGKLAGSPFTEEMKEFRDELDQELEALGGNPRRKKSDRESEVNFRRLC